MKIFIRTLGCKMNWLDAARVGAALQQAGHTLVAAEAEADYVLVNSCTVTAEADRKSRQAAHAASRADKQVAVIGCGPRADPVQWQRRLPGTVMVGSEGALLARFGIEADELPFPVNSRTRLPVAIQTGCDDICSFCITRIARGPHRSIPAARIIEHIQEAHVRGIREVVLTGINLAAWGCEHTRRPEQTRLAALLRRILVQTPMPRVRLSSLGPQYLDAAFFEAFQDPRLCEHLHLSVQSGSDSVLRRMQRGHDAASVYHCAERARALRPGVALTADFIVGYPGETATEFADTLAMVQRVGFAKLHVFPFSARAGTPAAEFGQQLGEAEKRQRSAALRAAGRAEREAFIRGQLGRVQAVLVETGGSGWSSNYIRVRVDGAQEGEVHELRLTAACIAES